jgi:hypothetical protein
MVISKIESNIGVCLVVSAFDKILIGKIGSNMALIGENISQC